MTLGITVCIPTIPPRSDVLSRALESVVLQTLRPESIIVEYDHDRTGAAATKNRAIAKATTEWVAMLDDDDEFLSHHLETLAGYAEQTGADLVYSVPEVPQRPDKRATGITRDFEPFDADLYRVRSYIQSNVLMRTKVAVESGGYSYPPGSYFDDWGLGLNFLDAGATIMHCPEVTFVWNHWGYGTPGIPGNTSGKPDRW